MIAWAGAERLALGLTDPLDTAPRARWPLDEVTKPAQPESVFSRALAIAREGRAMSFDRFAVLGARRLGHRARQRCRARRPQCDAVGARCRSRRSRSRRQRESPRLPGMKLADGIAVTERSRAGRRADRRHSAGGAGAGDARGRARTERCRSPSGTPVIACAKGIERGTDRFMTEVIAECAQTALPAILSGPSFAADVARGLPTAVTLAAKDLGLAERLTQALGSGTFRPYHSTDVRGVEIGGAAKNVLAIAAGIATGRGLGASAVAALTTRGFAELVRFGRAFSAQPETLTGLSGLGDLVLTCSSPQSRNFSLGIALGKGEKLGRGSSRQAGRRHLHGAGAGRTGARPRTSKCRSPPPSPRCSTAS